MNYEELTQAGIEVPELLDRLMNNAALVRMIIGKFLDDKSFAQLQEAVAKEDWKAAEFACHALKGVSGNLSLKKLFELSQTQLQLFRSGQPQEAAAMTPAISEAYEQAAARLRTWLAQK